MPPFRSRTRVPSGQAATSLPAEKTPDFAPGAVLFLEVRLREVVARLGQRRPGAQRFVVDDQQRGDQQQQREAADGGQAPVLLYKTAEQLPGAVLVGAHVAAGEPGLDLARDLFGAAVAGGAVALERVLGDGGQLRRRVFEQRADARDRLGDDLGDDRVRRLAVEGRAAGEDLEEDGAEAPDIAALVDLLELALRLLRAHVRGRSERVAGQRRVGRAHQLRLARDFLSADVLLAAGFGEAPVEHHRLAELADHDVLGLQVPVDHAAAVRVGDGVADVGEVREELEPLGQGPRLRQLLLQRDAADQLLRVVGGAVGVEAQLVDGHDVGVLELAGDAGFADEARRRGLRGAARRARAAFTTERAMVFSASFSSTWDGFYPPRVQAAWGRAETSARGSAWSLGPTLTWR